MPTWCAMELILPGCIGLRIEAFTPASFARDNEVNVVVYLLTHRMKFICIFDFQKWEPPFVRNAFDC